MEVKAVGQPKPVGKWLKHGTEIIPSDEFIIENFDDGTSVLTISEVYPDDTGEITFEAHNPLGVAVTVTELSVEGKTIHSITYFLSLIYNLIKIMPISLFLAFQPALNYKMHRLLLLSSHP